MEREAALGGRGGQWHPGVVESLRCELFPADMDAAVSFYTDVLGFEVVRDERTSSAPYVGMARGAARLGLAQRAEVTEVGQRRPPAGVELVLEVADLDAGYQQVVAAGWPLEEDLTVRPWGLSDFRVLDPAGYYWRITTGADSAP